MRETHLEKTGSASANSDESAVIDALLADIAAVQDRFPALTLPQYRILLEVLQAERRGALHTVVSLARRVQLPMSSASRMVWQLTKEGGDAGLLRYERHPSDRRRKYLRIERNGAGKVVPDALLAAFAQRPARRAGKV